MLADGADGMGSWIDRELAGCAFADARLGKRFAVLMEQLSTGLGKTLPLACGDWANTKAAYRFLDNGRVNEQEILAGHFQDTRARVAAVRPQTGPVLVLHDTTELSFTRSDRRAIGQTRTAVSARRPPAVAHGLRALDAFEPGGDHRRAAAGSDGDQAVDAEIV